MDHRPKILCVDDEVNILRCLQRAFRSEPYDITTANSGPEALEIMEKDNFDLIISDQRMPEMTGSKLLKQVKEKYPHVIRIMLSGYSDFDSLVQAINEGEIFRFISKPWNNSELTSIIKMIFEQKRIVNIAKKELEHVSELMNLCESIEVTSNDSDGTIVLHLKNGEQSIPDGLVTSAINAILNVLGIDKDKNPELVSGSVSRRENGVLITINLDGGVIIKLELIPNT
ncbi:MAG: response regulator [Candidatus Omnitrophica bacterium]|nr:response regulator [Candidatus Omnitrophota bacterium]